MLLGSRSGTRTRVSTVRGWRANRYTNRPDKNAGNIVRDIPGISVLTMQS